ESGDACEVPAFSQYRFDDRRWRSLDSTPLTSRCSSLADASYWQSVRSESGPFQVTGDTIALFATSGAVAATPVLLGRVIGDTIIFWGSDVEPGDWLYVRVP